MPIGVLMPVEKEADKSRAAKASTVYKCIMVKCDIDSELDNKDIYTSRLHITQWITMSLSVTVLKISPKIYVLQNNSPIPHEIFLISFKFMYKFIRKII